MPVLVVANNPKDWPFGIPNVEVIDARAYLTDSKYSDSRNVRVFNLCRSYRYQTTGYYVSLLAEARGHRPLPNITTIQDMKNQVIVRLSSEDMDELIQHSLSRVRSDRFELSIYFGRNMNERYQRLAMRLFNQFQAPLLRAQFARVEERWVLRNVAPISGSEVPEPHWPFVITTATRYFAGQTRKSGKAAKYRFDLAILYDPAADDSPSDEKAIKKFSKAAMSLGLRPELITRDDYARIAEFDALFIRETTAVNHHTYRFASRAASEGLEVIDDPQSIVKCTNKVYLAELLARHKITMPRTLVVHRDNWQQVVQEIGFPCVLKKPDSAFSKGVVKVEDEHAMEMAIKEFFFESELLVVQEFLPTNFDWRITLIDGQPLFACKYFMAPEHWQIIRQDRSGDDRYGNFECLPVELAPRQAVRTALKAANCIGNGLYGVDIKENQGKFYVIEVNDNPNIDAGTEDRVLREELYLRVMRSFLRRIEMKKANGITL